MPAERQRHRLVARRLDASSRSCSASPAEPQLELEPVREREHRQPVVAAAVVERRRRATRCRSSAPASSTSQSSAAASAPWIGRPFSSARTIPRAAVDRHRAAGGRVAPVAQAVRPRVQERQPERAAGAAPGVEPAALDEQLLAAVLQRAADHPRARGRTPRAGRRRRATTASSCPSGMRSSVAIARSLRVRAGLRSRCCAAAPTRRPPLAAGIARRGTCWSRSRRWCCSRSARSPRRSRSASSTCSACCSSRSSGARGSASPRASSARSRSTSSTSRRPGASRSPRRRTGSRSWCSWSSPRSASSVAEAARLRAQEAEQRGREADLAAELARVLLGAPDLPGALAPGRAADRAGVRARRRAGSCSTRSARTSAPPRSRSRARTSGSARCSCRAPDARRRPRRSARRSRRCSPPRSNASGSSREVVETRALRRSDEIKTAVLRAVSHDLRSPLTGDRGRRRGARARPRSPTRSGASSPPA